MNANGFRRAYADDPTLYERIFTLLDSWTPEIRATAERAKRLRLRWEDVTTPFVCEQGEQVISHVGVLEVPLLLLGRETRVAGVHAVCTHPDHRRRGHYRRLMEEVLEWCDARFDTIELSTEDPPFYEPFGFRRIAESTFVARVDAPGNGRGLRRLAPESDADLKLLDRLLEVREPVSAIVGVVRENAVFKFNAVTRDLDYCEALDALIVSEREGTKLNLLDVVAPHVPPLWELVRELDQPTDEVHIHFSPDRLDVETEPGPVPAHEGVYMVRGPFPPEKHAFMVPPTARH